MGPKTVDNGLLLSLPPFSPAQVVLRLQLAIGGVAVQQALGLTLACHATPVALHFLNQATGHVVQVAVAQQLCSSLVIICRYCCTTHDAFLDTATGVQVLDGEIAQFVLGDLAPATARADRVVKTVVREN